MKRFLDVFTVVFFMPFWFLAACVVGFLILLIDGFPVFFIQDRVGKDGKIFKLLKFRTMKNGRGSDEDRLSVLGRILRAMSLDELPQLINVLKGDMSLVGPRPLLVEYLPRYSKEQMRRHEVRPGITGWAQVKGRNAISWKKKFEYDVWYVDNRNLFPDFKILLMTVFSVLRRDGISSSGCATMPEFTGREED